MRIRETVVLTLVYDGRVLEVHTGSSLALSSHIHLWLLLLLLLLCPCTGIGSIVGERLEVGVESGVRGAGVLPQAFLGL